MLPIVSKCYVLLKLHENDVENVVQSLFLSPKNELLIQIRFYVKISTY
jgi:hypothetical protein